MHPRTTLTLSALTLLTPFAAAQEKYWVASGTTTVTQMDASGFPWQSVAPGSARDIGVAPDGKVWITNASITVLNADGSPFTTITPGAGLVGPYAVAFDRAGHAWVTGSTSGVEEFTAAGVSLGTLTLPVGQCRQICVDANDNKWIAHRVGPPGSVSRIDGVTRVVTNHLLPSTALFLPIGIYADSRGILGSSRIWTVGDNRGAGAVCELDATGTVLNTYLMTAAARLQWMCGDCDATGVTRFLWIGDWGNGDLYKVDVATGLATNFPQAVGVGGVTFDGFANLWLTMRAGGVVRRVNQANGSLEISSAVGATNTIATRWQHATVVDQLGDIDGDGAANLLEVMGGSSPFDRCSLPAASLAVRGPQNIGSSFNLAVQTAPSSLSVVGFATGTTATPLVFPGIGCSVQLDPAAFLVILAQVGPGNVALTIPNNPSYIGFRLMAQALDNAATTFTNVAPMLFF